MKQWWEPDTEHEQRSVCRTCHREIVKVHEVGWVDPSPGGSYDLCDADPLGAHSPESEPAVPTRPPGYGAPW